MKNLIAGLFLASAMAVGVNAADNVVIPKGYTKLVFQDEFNKAGMPDTTKWVYEKGYIRNGEMQYYTARRRENCYTADGLLHIVALNDSARIDGEIRPVTSASIQTRGKHFWKYCYVEVRAKLPKCLGSWPAIWMMPEKSVYGSWPRSGEIDIMEHVGYDPDKVHFSVHSLKYNHMINTQFTSHTVMPGTDKEFHVYGLEWKEDSITWFIDGKPYYTVTNEKTGWEAWPFDQDFYLKLNQAFGGGWGGSQGVNLKELPQDYQIDYVRIYQ